MVHPTRRPYESGEVIVQPYNTLLTLSHLADLSDGILLLENEALHRTAQRLYGIARPSFQVRPPLPGALQSAA
jgi:tubulin delta